MSEPISMISIIIINWNSKNYIDECLKRLTIDIKTNKFEILVVDNASYDGCGQLIETKYPDVRFIQLEKNLGFSGANNVAASKAIGSVLLFLNPDTEPNVEIINVLTELFKDNEDIGAVGGLLLNSDMSIQMSSLMPFPTLLHEILDIEIIIKLFNKIPFFGVFPLFSKKRIDKIEVNAISGACLAVKKDLFVEIGGFSRDYFMYSEDIDLCYRLKKKGKKNIYTNKIVMVHHGGTSAKKQTINAFSVKMKLESKKKFFRNHYGKTYSNLYSITMILIAIFRIILLTALAPLLLIKRKHQLKNSLIKWINTLKWAFFNTIRCHEKDIV